MIAGETVSSVKSSDKDMRLITRGNHYEIISNGIFLMATYGGKSEIEMVEDGLFYLSQNKLSDIKVLIAGLGVGYSLMPAVFDERVTQVDVVELEEEIIQWNNNYFQEYNQGVLNSDKVRIICGDIYDYLNDNLSHNQVEYDLIILDVDNGPDWLVRANNSRLYERDGLSLLKKNLSDSGYAAIWSMTQKDSFEKALLEQFEFVFIRHYMTTDSKGRYYRYPVYFAS